MNSFSTFFPTPQFLKLPVVGLDISDQSIRFLELVPGYKGYVAGRFGERKIAPGIVETGKIKDIDGLKKVLSSVQREHGFHYVNVGLPEEQAYLYRTTLPKIKRSEIRASIELQLEEYVPLKAEDATFDYEVIKETPEGYDVQVSALPKTISVAYYNMLSDIGFEPVVFEIEAQAIARAVLPRGDKGTSLIVDFGEVRTGIAVVSEGVVMYTSTLDIGGKNLNEAIEKVFNVNREKAEEIKKNYGLTRSDENTKELFFALMHPISILKDEINKHFIYWHTHTEPGEKERKKIESIILCGGDSNLLGLSDYLGASLRIPVTVANVWRNVNSFDNYIPEIHMNDSLRYATTIGLALGSIYDYD